MNWDTPICVGCGLPPEEIDEYVMRSEFEAVTPTAWCIENEGTLNMANGHFYCTLDYIKNGQPLGVAP